MENDYTFSAKWTPVTEAMPEPGRNVLACLIDGRRRKVTKYGNEYRTTIRIDKVVDYGDGDLFWSKGDTPAVVAWMPLPVAPKVTKEDRRSIREFHEQSWRQNLI